jgi:hypothetical protein
MVFYFKIKELVWGGDALSFAVQSLNRAYWGSRFLCMVSLSCGLWKRYCSKEGLLYSQDLKSSPHMQSSHSEQNWWLPLDVYFEIKVQVIAFGCKQSCSLHARCVVYIISRFLDSYLDSFTCSELDYGSLFIHMQNEVQAQLYMPGVWRSNQEETHQRVNL